MELARTVGSEQLQEEEDDAMLDARDYSSLTIDNTVQGFNTKQFSLPFYGKM